MDPADSARVSRDPAYSGAGRRPKRFAYGALTLCGAGFQRLPLRFGFVTPYFRSYYPGGGTPPVWALPLSLAATHGIDFSFSSSRYLDVSVPWVVRAALWIRAAPVRAPPDHGPLNGYPGIFAVFHALQSLLMPRHPPCTLIRFIAETSRSNNYYPAPISSGAVVLRVT